MKIRRAREADLEAWTGFRIALWPGCDPDELREEARGMLTLKDEACFVLADEADAARGCAEAAIHHGPEGPYVHLEAWYVEPELRGRGHGWELVQEVGQWALHRAIPVLTSDTTPDYPLSPPAHARAGFRKIHEMTIFLKELDPRRGRDSD